MTLTAQLSPDRLRLNDAEFVTAAPIDAFRAVLGRPSRTVEPSAVAPAGHRNNQIHIYDSIGIYLNEHHYTFLVSAVTFVFVPDEAHFPPATAYTGELRLGGASIRPGMDENALADCRLPFEQRLRGRWSVDAGVVWLGVETKGQRDPSSRRRSRRRLIVEISACLPHDPWDSRFRSEQSKKA